MLRNLTCYCENCTNGQPCSNMWVEQWGENSMKKENALIIDKTNTEESDEESDDEDIEFPLEDEKIKNTIEQNQQNGSETIKIEVPSLQKDSKPVVMDYADFCAEQTKPKINKKKSKKAIKLKKLKPKIKRQLKKILQRSDINYPPAYERYDVIHPFLSSTQQRVDYVREDGNCLFRAVSKSMSGSEVYFADYRSIIVDFIENYQEVFEMYVDGDFETHVTKMKKKQNLGNTGRNFRCSFTATA